MEKRGMLLVFSRESRLRKAEGYELLGRRRNGNGSSKSTHRETTQLKTELRPSVLEGCEGEETGEK